MINTVNNAADKIVTPIIEELLGEKDRLIYRLEAENTFLRVNRSSAFFPNPSRRRTLVLAWVLPARGGTG